MDKKRDNTTFLDRLADGLVTPAEAEAYAAGLVVAMSAAGLDTSGKHYDPLVVDEDEKVAHTYIFDLWDGGRHHQYEDLADVCKAMTAEATWNIAEENGRKLNECQQRSFNIAWYNDKAQFEGLKLTPQEQ